MDLTDAVVYSVDFRTFLARCMLQPHSCMSPLRDCCTHMDGWNACQFFCALLVLASVFLHVFAFFVCALLSFFFMCIFGFWVCVNVCTQVLHVYVVLEYGNFTAICFFLHIIKSEFLYESWRNFILSFYFHFSLI